MNEPQKASNTGGKQFAVCCGCFGALIVTVIAVSLIPVFFMTAGLSETAHAHVQLIKDGKVDDAYAATSQSFQANCSLDQFKAYVAAQQVLYAGSDLTITNVSVLDSTGTASGTTTHEGGTTQVSFDAVKVGVGWALEQVHVEGGGDCPPQVSGETSTPDAPDTASPDTPDATPPETADTTPPEASAPEASDPTVPKAPDPTPPEARAPAPPTEDVDPLAPLPDPNAPPARGKPFASDNGLVAVLAPTGRGWELSQATQSRGGASVTLVKCKSTDPARFFFLIAKDYTVPKAQVMPAQSVFHQVYKKNYQRMFQRLEILREGPAPIGGHQGYEVRLALTHKAKGEIRKVERLVTRGTHVLLLSAEGSPAAFDALGPEIETWLDGTRFKTLER